MNKIKLFLTIFALVLFAFPALSQQDTGWNSSSPLGFDFGISKDDALKKINSNGNKVIENAVDSKEIRTIMIEGAMVELPAYADPTSVKTELEFYDKELASSSIIFKPADSASREELQVEIGEFLVYLFGDPESKDSFLYFHIWTWNIPKVKLVLSANQKDNLVKVQYTFEPANKARKDKEIELIKRGPGPDPAKEMFLDGDYSKPTGYGE